MWCYSRLSRQFRRALVFLVALLAYAFLSTVQTFAQSPAAEVVPGEYIVKLPRVSSFTTGRMSAAAAVKADDLQIEKELGDALLVSRVRPYSAISARRFGPINPSDDTCARLLASGSVSFCEPNYKVHAFATPNDPQFAAVWALNARQGIDAPRAWDATVGSAQVVVAVVDTGVDYTHPDIAANMWVNQNEVAGNGLDDDHNGYVDDVHGINTFSGNGDPMDDSGHGTHVAGTIGAVGNNGIGISGVSWNVKVMALKFLDDSGSGSIGDAIEALKYMIAMKQRGVPVKVSNNSWGGGDYSQALKEAVQKAEAAGIIFVTAAGNESADNDSTPSYPANLGLSNVISVAAVDQDKNLAYFSNFGARKVDIAAPGVNILSLAPGGAYRTMSGTSMATPVVSGALALLAAAEPALSVAEMVARLYDTALPSPTLSGTIRTGRVLNVGRMIANQTSPLVDSTPKAPSCPFAASSLALAPDLSADSGEELINNADELNYQSFALPFSMPFDGENISTVTVSPNGVLYMGREPGDMDYEPSGKAPAKSIAALHTDMVSTVKAAVTADSATFFWKGHFYAEPAAGSVEVRLTLKADGSVQEWLSFSSARVLQLVKGHATIGINGQNVSHAVTLASPAAGSGIKDGMSVLYVPACEPPALSGDSNPVAIKGIKLWGVQATQSKGLTPVLSPGRRFKVRVSATAGGVSKSSQVNFYLGNQLCTANTTVEVRGGRSWIKGALPAGIAGRFGSLKVEIENAASRRKIQSGRMHQKTVSAQKFDALCQSIARSTRAAK